MTDVAIELGSLDTETKRALLKRLLAERAQQRATDVPPSIEPDRESRYEPFPLTDVQQAYWVGRGNAFDLGQVSCHAYSELELGQIDLARLERAWQALVARHDMLRTIVRPDGQQQILERVNPYTIHATDARGWSAAAVDAHMAAVRRRLSHQVLPADRWPLFEICATLLDGGRTRLHTSLDLLVVDFWSIVMLVREWFEVYASPQGVRPPADISFRDYVLAERALRKTELYARSMQFWRERLDRLAAPPELPLAKSPGSGSEATFIRHASRLEPDVWSRLKHRGAAAGLTSSSVLLAAFADVLTTWSRSPRFTLNLTLFYRLPLHAQVNELVGDFTSVSFLDVDNGSRDSFEERAKRHQTALWENLEHRYVSGIEVLRELARTHGGERALMPVVFTSLLGLTRSDRDAGGFTLPGQVVYAVSQTPQVWLDHQVYEQDGALVFSWDVRDDLFPSGLIADMFQAYCHLLHDLTLREEPWQAPAPCRLPDRQEASQLRFNQTEEPIAAGVVHDIPGAAVANPTDVVLVDPRRSVTRGELDRAAAHLAGQLRRLGVRPDSLVAIAMEKGWEELTAALGILRAGAAYLPVDPRLPRERFQQLLERGDATIVLTQPWLDERLCWPAGVKRIVVSETILSQPEIHEPRATASPDSLAYVLFTSGSTGEPKGVMIDHRAVANTIADMNARFGVGPSDRFFGVSSLGFDLSVYDLFGAYAAGAATVLPRQDGLADPAHWFQLLTAHDVTVWNSVPVLMRLLVEYLEARRERLPSSLRLVLLSGDWIPVSLPDRVRALGEGIEVVSLGGATEASIWSIWHRIDTVDPSWPSVPYGRPLANQRFYVLNRSLEPCPTWVEGELYIGGVGLARGYWRDPVRTDASFIRHPVSGERLYRTGDRGRFLPSGEIEFLGREDLQVKVQGYRIELGEIEAVLRRHPAVRDVALAARADVHGDRRLVAGIVLAPELPAPSLPSFREFVSERLPAYMVPSDIALVDRLPVNANGKIDREALTRLATDASRPSVAAAPVPADAVLTGKLTAIIAPMLGLDAIAPDDDLVSLGATSVDIVRIANALEEQLGARPNIGEFYHEPTIAGLAASYASRARHQAESTLEPAVASTAVTAIEDEDAALLLDPAAREAFKSGQPGLRQDADTFGFVPLRSIPADPIVLERHSQRAFAPTAVDFEVLSSLMAGLRALSHDGGVKYPYPSAGGVYAVQAYLHVKEGRVDGLGGGLYYYRPLKHQLAIVSADFEIDRVIHEPFINRPIYDAAAFSIFLIARLGAIRPLYGRHAKPFALLEAGAMLQALMMTAVHVGVGLCPIGDLAFDRIRPAFVLDESDQLVHSLIGGRLPDQTPRLSTA